MSTASAGPPSAVPTSAVQTCHVVTHVHWDREWYRPFEGFRSRLLELVTRVCAAVESGALASFHLDGQTVTLDDVAAENLVRNLFLARRVAGGSLSTIGYSPDAFGHPADLPRVLRGFGIDTALVWRGAPPELARFRWRSADGSEVFTVNQAYHQAEVLWDEGGAPSALTAFLEAERRRAPDGPWLLLNGGDHLYPVHPRDRADALAAVADVAHVRESTLAELVAEARAADPEPPVVEGELRYLGDRLTFLLPGTLSARAYVKQLNDRAQVLLERFVEPALATAPAGAADAPGSGPELLRHAWELLVQNAPHDSICGCSVDEVHRETTVRAERVLELGDQLVRRAALALRQDTRGLGRPPTESVPVLVRSGDGDVTSMPVVVEVVTAAGRHVAALRAPDGTEVPVEAECLGAAEWFEADLDLMPDTSRGSRHRLAFVAAGLPAFGGAVWTAVLGPDAAREPDRRDGDREATVDGVRLRVEDDASVTLTTADGVTHRGLGVLVDGGDRGDSYTYDPPAEDVLVRPRVRHVRSLHSPVRARLVVDAVLDVPRALATGRDARAPGTVELPVRIVVERWTGDPVVRWTVELDNTAADHRLRWHARVEGPADGELPRTWLADTHWSVQERPFGPVVGTLPTEPALEAPIGTSPAHTFAVAGDGPRRVAVLLDALPEVQGLHDDDGAALAVTLLRAVGWLSRFDLRTRTTGAGPAFEVPEAQCRGPRTARLAVLVGEDADDPLGLAQAAARHRAGVWATPLRATEEAGDVQAVAPRVRGALVSALKTAEAGDGLVLRVANPTPHAGTAHVELPAWVRGVRELRLDETVLDEAVLDETDLDEAVLDEAVLAETVLDEAVLDEAVLDEAVLDEAVPDGGGGPEQGAAGRSLALDLAPYGVRTVRLDDGSTARP